MESGPPCKRCAEKNLGCVLNKSLQTLINERSQTSEAMVHDIETIHAGLQKVLRTLNLPPLTQLHSSSQMLHAQASFEEHGEVYQVGEVGPSCDNSPKISPEDDNDLPKVPIHSVYHLTKLSALRSPDANEMDGAPRQPPNNMIDDFISRGALSVEDAERLFRLYMDHLDHFMYGIGGRHKSLDALRRSSRILSACIFTVAALHDPQSNSIYGVCSKEFRRLMAASIFNRRLDRDYLRAMCIASYWLSDISWMVSGYAIRRAAEFNLASHYRRAITDGNHNSVDLVRVWYILYVCDQHLSTLYGRQSVIREDIAVEGWEGFIQRLAANDDDKRLVSQVALLNILSHIRDLFGPNLGEPVPQVYLMHIAKIEKHLDQWLGHWSTSLLEHHDRIGSFPRKGVLLHFHFAKLHLYSHVFRGLRNTSIPPYFLDCATSATTAATAIVNLLITDPEIQPALSGMPSYMHSMTGFACMFLAKLTMIHGDHLIERSVVIDLASRLIHLYRSTAVGKWHLIKLMADGLEKIVETLRNSHSNAPLLRHHETAAPLVPFGTDENNFADFREPGASSNGDGSLSFDNLLMDYNMSLGASQLMYLSSGPTGFDSSDLSPPFP